MNIDGVNTLACLSRIERKEEKVAKIYPLPHSECQVSSSVPPSTLTISRVRPSMMFPTHLLPLSLPPSLLLNILSPQCTSSKISYPISLNSTNNTNPSNLSSRTITLRRKVNTFKLRKIERSWMECMSVSCVLVVLPVVLRYVSPFLIIRVSLSSREGRVRN